MDFCWDHPQHLERKTEKMNKDKESVVQLMVAVYESINTKMALMSGMTEEEAEAKTQEANPAMIYYMSEIYNKLDENDIIKYE